MHLVSRTRLILLEAALAAAAVGYAYRGVWTIAGGVVGAICLLAAVISVRGKAPHQVVASWMRMRSRRRRSAGTGIASVADGSYEVVNVPPGSGGVSIGAIRDATTWTIALELPLTGVLNDDAALPVERLASLLTVEDVPLASVRLVTLTPPPQLTPGAPAGPVPPLPRFVSRYLVMTLDVMYAADAISQRGGDEAVPQILRRCVLRAEEMLRSFGIQVSRLDSSVVANHSAISLGQLPRSGDGAEAAAKEAMDRVHFATAAAMTFAVTGPDALAHLHPLALELPAPLVATSVVLTPGSDHNGPELTLLLRVSGDVDVLEPLDRKLTEAGRARGLDVHRLLGEQVPSLRATTLLGVPKEAA